MRQNHSGGRRPVVGGRGNHGRRADILGMARAGNRDRRARVAHVRDDGHAFVYSGDGTLHELALFAVAQAHRFPGVQRQRERIGAVTQMEFDQPRERVEIDAAVRLEGGNGNVYQAGS